MKAALIGFDQTHLDAYQASGVEIVCVVERDKTLRESFECNTASSIGTIAEPAPGLVDADVVSICSRPEFHFEQTKICIELGKHVICKSPPCMRHDEVHRLHQMAQQSGLFYACDLSGVLKIEQGLLNDEKSLLTEYTGPNLLGGLVHALDLTLWMKPWQILDGAAFNYEDDVISTVFKFADGSLGNVYVLKRPTEGLSFMTSTLSLVDVELTTIVPKAVEYIENGRTWDNIRLWHALDGAFGIQKNAGMI